MSSAGLFRTGSVLLLISLAAMMTAEAAPNSDRKQGPPNVGEEWFLTFESEFLLPGAIEESERYSIDRFDQMDETSDDAKWEYRIGPNKDAIAVEENVFVTAEGQAESVLVLRTSVQSGADEIVPENMRTGYVRTRNYERTSNDDTVRFAQKYGYFEARIRFDPSPGQWGAFWLMPEAGIHCAEGSGRDAAEIDIVEGFPHRPRRSKNRTSSVNLAVHYDGYGLFHQKQGVTVPRPHQKQSLPEFDSSEFHTYGFLWTPDQYVWFLDGIPVYQITDPDLISQREKYIKLSTEVAKWAGEIDPDLLPADTVVDWVRVWQTDRLDQGNPYIFDVKDDPVELGPRVILEETRTGQWCQSEIARAAFGGEGELVIPISDPVSVAQIGLRVSNSSDPDSSVTLMIDGRVKKRWKKIDLDPLFILKLNARETVSEEIKILWSGEIGINQVYLVAEAPFYPNFLDE